MNSSNYTETLLGGRTQKNTKMNLSGFTFSDQTGGLTTVYISSDDIKVKENIPDGVITKLSMLKPTLSECPSGSYTKSYLSEKGIITTVIFLQESGAEGSTWTYEIKSTTGYSYITEYRYKGLIKTKLVNRKKYSGVIEIEQNLYTIIDGTKELTLNARSWYSEEFGLIDRY